ncbi:MAG: hypothetical protein LQ344_001394 [Seirophora lacunosa]|nr:MAG: hypothetical protein LQ344_001394 [Seirophora lacunosa]
MDEEQADDYSDIKLQRDSANLREELCASIPLFLYQDVNANPPSPVRKWVKQSNTAKLAALINTFQEWPQLLDTSLRPIAEPLVSAFNDYIQRYPDRYFKVPRRHIDSVEPLPRAVCKLLYTLCKVRGTNVISIFFSNEPSLLEPLLDAFEIWASPRTEEESSIDNTLTWEERYIMLLWLSHLTQTPFDLAIISSSDAEQSSQTSLMPPLLSNFPGVAQRLLALGFRYLFSVSKERDAAKLLLVRLCMRPDMDRLGLKQSCMEWLLQSLGRLLASSEPMSIHSVLGGLSFLAGFFKSCDGVSIAPFVVTVLNCTEKISAGGTVNTQSAYASAAVRKLIVKIHRVSAMHLLSGCPFPADSEADGMTLLGNIIDHLMTCLGDKDNTVRFAASKALSIVTQKLDPDMKEQLLDALTEKLRDDVVLRETANDMAAAGPLKPHMASPEKDFSTADALQWQGLILTMSHLLYRHSVPEAKLPTVVGLLMNALDFEQRSSTGASTGSIVRDAACFGMWSVARKYTTTELTGIVGSVIGSRRNPRQLTSVFPVLAAELVLTAALDPEGNIRRATSAALQELVGRHPDVVPRGIDLVQIVDYQAVGLRSRAMSDVALQAANLDPVYLYALVDGLLSWRAIASPNVVIRRHAATVVGKIFHLYGSVPIAPLQQRIEDGRAQSLDEWHGLYLALAEIVRRDSSTSCRSVTNRRDNLAGGPIQLLREGGPISTDDIVAKGKKAYLAAEALCTMMSALGESSFASIVDRDNESAPPNKDSADLEDFEYHMAILEQSYEHSTQLPPIVIRAAAVSIFNQLRGLAQKRLLLDKILYAGKGQIIERIPEARVGWIIALGGVFQACLERTPALIDECRVSVYDALISQLGEQSHWLSKTAALRHLYKPVYLAFVRSDLNMMPLHQALLDCLDDRSVANSREVGSEVRMQAIETIGAFNGVVHWNEAQRVEIFGRVCGLALEKIDKIRDSAWRCIVKYPDAVLPKVNRCVHVLCTVPERMAALSTSSVMYFNFMLNFCNDHRLRPAMMRGLITSASSGGEALLGAVRLAIGRFATTCSAADAEIFYDSLLAIINAEMPAGRLLWPGLEVLAFLLETDIIQSFAEPFNGDGLSTRTSSFLTGWRTLLDRLTTLQKGSNLRNWNTLVQVYTGLARYDELCERALAKLRRLHVHQKFPSVRLAAAAAFPLSSIPGPPLAVLTVHYQTYYNVIKGGQFLFKIQDLHRRYGPIVRIGPNEIHINDPEFYEQIYSLHGRWDKDPAFVNQFDNTGSAFGTIHHDLHRIRRRAFQSFFSKQKIISLEPLIQSRVDKLCQRLEGFAGTDKEVPIRHAYECLTNDIVMEYTLGKSDHSVEHPDFNPVLHETIKLLGMSGHYMKLIPGIQSILPFIPPSLITFLVPAMAPIVALQKQCNSLASTIISSAPSYDPKSRSHPTVCHEIYYSDELPPSEKTLRRMQHEVETFVVAGTETTAHALACTTFHVLNDAAVLRALKAELAAAGGGEATLQTLEQLPFLTAVILEGLRLSYGVATRLPRIAPDQTIRYGGYTIPPGFDDGEQTPVSMSSMLLHHNPSVFPDPLTYHPQRWMGMGQRQRLERYLVNFSKGTRQCVGIKCVFSLSPFLSPIPHLTLPFLRY